MKISASSTKAFRRCPRRWYGLKILKLVPAEETAATNLGKETHAELETWTKSGTVPTSALAAKMLAAVGKYPYWPDPKNTQAESAIEFELDGVDFHGFVDYRRQGAHAGHRVTGDYKTTSNLDYALKAEGGLLVDRDGEPDVQSSIYAAYEYVLGAKEVSGVWVYGQTKPPHTTRLVTVDFDQAAVEGVMRGVCETGRQMNRLAVLQPALEDVPFNPGACFDYHRPCPLREAGLCCANQSQGLFSPPNPLDITVNPMALDFLTSIRNSAPAATTDAPPPPPADDDAPPPPPEDDDAPPPPPPADEPHLAERIAAMFVNPERDLSTVVESGFINPPEAAGKAPYRNPAEAAEGEGVKAPAPKAKKGKAAKASPIMASVSEAVVGLERAGVAVKPDADAVLREIYLLLKDHFER